VARCRCGAVTEEVQRSTFNVKKFSVQSEEVQRSLSTGNQAAQSTSVIERMIAAELGIRDGTDSDLLQGSAGRAAGNARV
jgi:hypothetical protein